MSDVLPSTFCVYEALVCWPQKAMGHETIGEMLAGARTGGGFNAKDPAWGACRSRPTVCGLKEAPLGRLNRASPGEMSTTTVCRQGKREFKGRGKEDPVLATPGPC